VGNAFCPDQCAVLLSRLTAPLYKEQGSIDVIAVKQASCQPVLQSTTEQWGMHFVQTSAAVHLSWLTAPLNEEQTSIGVIAVKQASFEPFLQSSNEQWGMHSAQTNAVVQLSWLTAPLYKEQISPLNEEQTSIGVVAVKQASCEPVLQSTTEQWGMHSGQTSAPVQLSWPTAPLNEEQTSIGVIAVKQASCEPVLQSSNEQWGMHSAQTSAAVQLSWPTAPLNPMADRPHYPHFQTWLLALITVDPWYSNWYAGPVFI